MGVPRLCEGGVHVWAADLDAPATMHPELETTLSAEERNRAGRFVSEKDRRRYVAGRGLLRGLLGRYLGTGPREIRLCYGPEGKPALAQPDVPLRFNLSHSGSVALYALTLDRAVGVDVERTDRPRDLLGVARRFFAPQEYKLLASAAPERRGALFYTLWTVKEACLKAAGQGLLGRTSSMMVGLGTGQPVVVRAAGGDVTAERWCVRALAMPPGYAAAVAVVGEECLVNCCGTSQAEGTCSTEATSPSPNQACSAPWALPLASW